MSNLTIHDFIELMNEDLEREYHHMHFYLHASAMVEGLHRHEISEFLFEEAQSELKHVREFSDQIISLDGLPTPTGKSLSNQHLKLTDPVDILKHVLEMETEVVGIFAQRMKQAEELPEPDGSVLHVFYENQILDSRQTANEVRKMLKGL